MKLLFFTFLLPATLLAQPFTQAEIARWQMQAKQVTIIRDNWGIPHVYGKTDADAVFGLLYAQCEDDFNRVEMNYIEKLGRTAEVKGAEEVYNDLMIRLIIDSADAIADYKRAPSWLKQLTNAFADGINYYLYKHPGTKPALLKRFQPWYALLWTDGSIGAISTAGITVNELKQFYGGHDLPLSAISPFAEPELTGSNGFAFGPDITASHNAILYINPHVSLYFRPEVHMVSEAGLNAYGAATWGQFFVYQGFNEHCGWMHTSSYADVSDAYIEKITRKKGRLFYTYNGSLRPVKEKQILLRYRDGSRMAFKNITALFTGHGPILANRNGQWLSLKSHNRDMQSLIQSWLRTRATSFAAYKKTMELRANTSNNTVYADAEGNIAYWHGNYIPIRNPKYNWSKPVDGSISATEWKGLHKVDEMVHLYNPPNGWLQNCNATPFTVAGENSPKRSDYPRYMAPDGQNFRGINAVRVLAKEKAYTADKVIAAGYDNYLAAFEVMIPALLKAFDKKRNDTVFAALAAPVDVLRKWDYRCGENSVATTLAVEWGQKLLPDILRIDLPDPETNDQVGKTAYFLASATAKELLHPLLVTVKELQQKFGRWDIPWGEINRFQRISGAIDPHYDDNAPSLPVGFTSSVWGMLPSYASRNFPGTQKRYGTNGNSFICVVEFGKKIKAKSLLAGGESGNPHSPHFSDQALMFTKGRFKEVLFYKEDVLQHAERTYHPGNEAVK